MSQSSNATGTAFPTTAQTKYEVSLPIEPEVFDKHHEIASDNGTSMDTVIAGLLAQWFGDNGGDVSAYPEEVRP